ncbi:hypothetical protein HRbin15_02400 [bacterium HR15]|nr:hypothetical protein HRbin15_02400 [bacterium HR15]
MAKFSFPTQQGIPEKKIWGYPEKENFVFGGVQRAYGSVWRSRSWVGARVWGLFVLWNMVVLMGVGWGW